MTPDPGFADLTGAKILVVEPVNLERLCSTLSALRRGNAVVGDAERYD